MERSWRNHGHRIAGPALGMAFVMAMVMTFAVPFGEVAAAGARRPMRMTDGSAVSFKSFGKKVVTPVQGRFATVYSKLSIDPQGLQTARGDISVMLGSILTEDATWDVLFRSAPFLGLDEHPLATFELRGVQGAKALKPNQWTKLSLRGPLSFRGEPHDMTIPAQARWQPAAAAKGGSKADSSESIQLKTTFKLRYADHGMKLPSGAAERFGGQGASVQVDLRFEPSRSKAAR